jgi:hypothetical protein
MSTKKIQRTVIEGGRTGSSKWNRRNSHHTERASERDYCRKITVDSERSENDIFIDPKEKVRKEFNDKLGPMYRWLHSQTGKVWNDVKSEIHQKFDNRTTAGRHILYDHLLSSVEEVPDLTYRRWYRDVDDYTSSRYKNDFYVDDAGLLQIKTYIPHGHTGVPKFNIQSIINWLHNRVVGKVGDKFYWFAPVSKSKKYGGTNKVWKIEWSDLRWQSHRGFLKFLYAYQKPIYSSQKRDEESKFREIIGYETVWQATMPNLRQDRKLNDKELIFWNSMPEWYQNKVLERSPTHPQNLTPKFDSYYYY